MAIEHFDSAPSRAVARLARVAECALDEVGLSLPQYRLLAFLSYGTSAAAALADHLTVTRPSVTALVDGLVARGLVTRAVDDADRRRVLHLITSEGEAALASGDAAIGRDLAELLELLAPDDATAALRGLTLAEEAFERAVAREETTQVAAK